LDETCAEAGLQSCAASVAAAEQQRRIPAPSPHHARPAVARQQSAALRRAVLTQVKQ